jgi:hypothetical protein
MVNLKFLKKKTTIFSQKFWQNLAKSKSLIFQASLIIFEKHFDKTIYCYFLVIADRL